MKDSVTEEWQEEVRQKEGEGGEWRAGGRQGINNTGNFWRNEGMTGRVRMKDDKKEERQEGMKEKIGLGRKERSREEG